MVTASGLYESTRQDAIDAAVIEMESNGFALDADYCHAQLARARDDEHAQLDQLAGIGMLTGFRPTETWDKVWSSQIQLRALLHEHLRLRPSPVWKKGRVKRGETKTDEVALDWVAAHHPEHRALLKCVINLRRIRGAIKYLSKLPTFIGPDGLIHPTLGPAGDDDGRVGAVSGRNAMKAPEGQQIPKFDPGNPDKDRYQIRRAFIAPAGGVLAVADYSFLEVVILAHLCVRLFGDHQLAEMVSPGAPDIHCANARKIFGELLGWRHPATGIPIREHELSEFKRDSYCKYLRQLVKAVWYGLQYGKGAYGFGASLLDENGDPIGEERAGVIVNGLLDAVPALRLYQEWVREFIERYHGIPSLAGRWCDLSSLLGPDADRWLRERAWRRALNFPMQAGAADIMGAAMVAVVRDEVLRNLGHVLCLQVHDEMITRGPNSNGAAPARLVELMQNAWTLEVPLQVSGDEAVNWLEAK